MQDIENKPNSDKGSRLLKLLDEILSDDIGNENLHDNLDRPSLYRLKLDPATKSVQIKSGHVHHRDLHNHIRCDSPSADKCPGTDLIVLVMKKNPKNECPDMKNPSLEMQASGDGIQDTSTPRIYSAPIELSDNLIDQYTSTYKEAFSRSCSRDEASTSPPRSPLRSPHTITTTDSQGYPPQISYGAAKKLDVRKRGNFEIAHSKRAPSKTHNSLKSSQKSFARSNFGTVGKIKCENEFTRSLRTYPNTTLNTTDSLIKKILNRVTSNHVGAQAKPNNSKEKNSRCVLNDSYVKPNLTSDRTDRSKDTGRINVIRQPKQDYFAENDFVSNLETVTAEYLYEPLLPALHSGSPKSAPDKTKTEFVKEMRIADSYQTRDKKNQKPSIGSCNGSANFLIKRNNNRISQYKDSVALNVHAQTYCRCKPQKLKKKLSPHTISTSRDLDDIPEKDDSIYKNEEVTTLFSSVTSCKCESPLSTLMRNSSNASKFSQGQGIDKSTSLRDNPAQLSKKTSPYQGTQKTSAMVVSTERDPNYAQVSPKDVNSQTVPLGKHQSTATNASKGMEDMNKSTSSPIGLNKNNKGNGGFSKEDQMYRQSLCKNNERICNQYPCENVSMQYGEPLQSSTKYEEHFTEIGEPRPARYTLVSKTKEYTQPKRCPAARTCKRMKNRFSVPRRQVEGAMCNMPIYDYDKKPVLEGIQVRKPQQPCDPFKLFSEKMCGNFISDKVCEKYIPEQQPKRCKCGCCYSTSARGTKQVNTMNVPCRGPAFSFY